jgi:hypothetical protein
VSERVGGTQEAAYADGYAEGRAAGRREARADVAARLREAVNEMRPGLIQHTCWDDHEGEGGTHADGSPCLDKPNPFISRAAVLAAIEEAERE